MTIAASRLCGQGQDGSTTLVIDLPGGRRGFPTLSSAGVETRGRAWHGLTGEDKHVFCHWVLPHFPFFQPVICPALSKALVISPQASQSTQNGMKTHSTLKKTRYNHR